MANLKHNPNFNKPHPQGADKLPEISIADMAAEVEESLRRRSNRTISIFAGSAKEKTDGSREVFVAGARLPADTALTNLLWFLGGCAVGYCAVRAFAK